MRISDVVVVTSIAREKVPSRGKYWVCVVKNFRASFNMSCSVNFYCEDGLEPQKHIYKKGVPTKMKDIDPASLWRVVDMHVEGLTDRRDPKNIRTLNRVSIYCVPYEKDSKFFEDYITRMLTREDETTYQMGMGWRNDENDGKGYQPFVYWKFIKYIFKNRHLYIQGYNEAHISEQVLLDKIAECKALEQKMFALEQKYAVYENFNLFWKNGKLKRKFYKDLKV